MLARGEESTAAKMSSQSIFFFVSCSVSLSVSSRGRSCVALCFSFVYLRDVVEVAQVLCVQDALAERVWGREVCAGGVREELEDGQEEHRARRG
eukprot:1328703-Rhodomonas_salina.1